MNKIKTILTSLALIFGLIMPNIAMARECHTVYGGGEVCENGDLSLDKEIWNPEEDEYWDNVDSSDYIFPAGAELKFRIKIKNIDDVTVTSSKIKDYLPSYVEYVSASVGNDDVSYDVDDDMIKYNTGSLGDNETKIVYLIARVKDSNEIPEGITCLKNKAVGYSDDDDESDTDYASFCIGKESSGTVLGTTAPDTGSNSLILWGEMVGFVSLGAGYIAALKKYSK